MGSIVLRGIISFEKFITSIVANNFSILGIAVGGIFAIVALILGYALLVQAAVFVIVSLSAIISERFSFLKVIRRSTDKESSEERDFIVEKSGLDKNMDKNRKVKIGSTYWTF